MKKTDFQNILVEVASSESNTCIIIAYNGDEKKIICQSIINILSHYTVLIFLSHKSIF